jgi:hypothetical protein
MRPPPTTLRRVLCLAVAVVLVAPLAAGAFSVGCGPNQQAIWVCFDPGTGHEGTYHDDNHYVGGVFDPCHCYDPCGPADTCPILVDAGPPPADAGCDKSDGGDGG